MAYNYPRTLVFLETKTASASASLEFTSKISSNFSTYYLSFRDILPSSGSKNLTMTFSTDNGSTYLATNYRYLIGYVRDDGVSNKSSSGAATSCRIGDTLSNTSTKGVSGEMYLYNLNSGTYSASYKGYFIHNKSTVLESSQVCGDNTGTTAVTAIKFEILTANITSGTITLYGVVEP